MHLKIGQRFCCGCRHSNSCHEQEHDWLAQVAAELEYAAGNAPETLLPMVLQLLASLLEFDRLALQESLPGMPHISKRATKSDNTFSRHINYLSRCTLPY